MNKLADKNPNDSDYYVHLLLKFLDFYANVDAPKNIISLSNGGAFLPMNEATFTKTNTPKENYLLLTLIIQVRTKYKIQNTK